MTIAQAPWQQQNPYFVYRLFSNLRNGDLRYRTLRASLETDVSGRQTICENRALFQTSQVKCFADQFGPKTSSKGGTNPYSHLKGVPPR